MIRVYRIAPEKYKTDLSGTGAKLFGGRWNMVDHPAVYASYSRALSILELLVHANAAQLNATAYEMLTIELPSEPKLHIELPHNALMPAWSSMENLKYTQEYGTRILTENKYLSITVPSALVYEEKNIVINPRHDQISKVRIVDNRIFRLDGRWKK